MESGFYGFETIKNNIMKYQEIENKLVEFVHKKEGKEYPIHEVNIDTAVDFAIELVKNCSIPDVDGMFSKEMVINILQKRADTAFKNQAYEKNKIADAIDIIETLMPPSDFPDW